MEERRRFQRSQAELIVRYKILDASGEKLDAKTKDIGGGGICLVTHERLDPGISLAVDIKLPSSTEPVVAVGRAVWSRDSNLGLSPGGHKRFDNGIEFMEIKDRDRQRIIEQVNAEQEKQKAEGWKIGIAKVLPK